MYVYEVFDYAILAISNKYCMTYNSDMQFGSKQNHSTVMCSLVYYEIIHHYLCNNSNLYSCLLDSSKAFDSVNYGTIFNILLSKCSLLHNTIIIRCV